MRQPIPLPDCIQTEVCILGAGVTGLAAGVVLTEAGVDTIVLERDEAVGGLSRTFVQDDFRFDLGGHRFFTKNEEVIKFVSDLVGREMITVDRKSSIYYRHGFFDYPVRISNVLRNLNIIEGAAVVQSYWWTKLQLAIRPKAPQSVEDWIVRQFGRRLYDIFFKSYTAKVWGVSGSEISEEWAGQRIRGFSLPVAIKCALFKCRERPQTLLEQFTYPELGIGRISERMAEQISSSNSILLRSKVTCISHNYREITGVEFQNGHGPMKICATQFISSLPVAVLVRLMDPRPPHEVIEATQSISFRGLIIVHLAIRKERVTDQSWIYIQEPRCLISRIHEPKNWSRKMVPAGCTSLVVEIPCTAGDACWARPDEEITRLAVEALEEELHFIKAGEVLKSCVVRVPYAYPVYRIGYKKPLEIMLNYLNRFENLQTSGRSGLHKYANIDHCLECGIKAAKNVLGASYDLRMINTEEAYLEESKT